MNTKRHRILRFKINLNFYSHFTAITVKRITDIVSFVFRCLFFSVCLPFSGFFRNNLLVQMRKDKRRARKILSVKIFFSIISSLPGFI